MKDLNPILKELKTRLTSFYGERLKRLILFGSWARGEATEDSDIDIVVVLDGDVIPGEEIDRTIDIINDINLKYDVLVSIYPVSESVHETVNSPLLLNLKKEGLSI